jgi:hypothetical protein
MNYTSNNIGTAFGTQLHIIAPKMLDSLHPIGAICEQTIHQRLGDFRFAD